MSAKSRIAWGYAEVGGHPSAGRTQPRRANGHTVVRLICPQNALWPVGESCGRVPSRPRPSTHAHTHAHAHTNTNTPISTGNDHVVGIEARKGRKSTAVAKLREGTLLWQPYGDGVRGSTWSNPPGCDVLEEREGGSAAAWVQPHECTQVTKRNAQLLTQPHIHTPHPTLARETVCVPQKPCQRIVVQEVTAAQGCVRALLVLPRQERAKSRRVSGAPLILRTVLKSERVVVAFASPRPPAPGWSVDWARYQWP